MKKVHEIQRQASARPLEVSSRSNLISTQAVEFRRYIQDLETNYKNKVVNYTGIDEKARQM